MTDLRTWLRDTLGHDPRDLALFERALTHGSVSKETYERLEFVGDRVVGLAIARWLYDRFPGESEGKLSRRYNVLVSRETCAEIGREIGLPGWIKLGKQAREDGANQSDNVIGDVVEALIGALLLDGGIENAEAFVRQAWLSYVESQGRAPKHPKSALQELAAAKEWAPPDYEVERKSGAHHAPRFTVRVSIKGVGEAAAEGSSKQEAETSAAAALLERLR
jgi:ribonuclease-3